MNAAQMLLLMTRRRKTYQQRVKALFGTALVGYWPLDELSGTVARDVGPTGYNGTISGDVTLATVASPTQSGKSSPAFGGTNGKVNLYSAPLAGAFNGVEGAILGWAKMATGVWADGSTGDIFALITDANDLLIIQKPASVSTLYDNTIYGGASVGGFTADFAPDGWFTWCLTWSKSNNRKTFYINGTNPYVSQALVGNWTGSIKAANFCIGSLGTAHYHKGNISDVVLLNREITQAEILQFTNGVYKFVNLSVIGDSVCDEWTDWPQPVWKQYLSGRVSLRNHAVGGQNIIANMAAQAAATASDHANICIMELGTNDDNSGNMATLQATIEAGIDTVRANNPGVTIYYMGVLPRWTNNTGATPVDKANIRTAQQAACTAKGVTYWDTFTSPWITAAQTTDGIHPNATTGRDAIAAQVLARI